LQGAKYLDHELGVLDVASTAAEVLVLDVCITDVTLVLDFDVLGFDDKAKNFKDVPDD
jgi:hypothetical protein